MTRTCRHCDQPAVSYSNTPLCRNHYNQRRRKGRPRQPRKPSTVCRECGAPRKPGVSIARCEEHYRIYARKQVRRSRGMDPDAPVKVVDTSKCRLCDEPRLPYGVMCRGCLRAYEAERRRKAGASRSPITANGAATGSPASAALATSASRACAAALSRGTTRCTSLPTTSASRCRTLPKTAAFSRAAQCARRSG